MFLNSRKRLYYVGINGSWYANTKGQSNKEQEKKWEKSLH